MHARRAAWHALLLRCSLGCGSGGWAAVWYVHRCCRLGQRSM
jgi:hypothetical protein